MFLSYISSYKLISEAGITGDHEYVFSKHTRSNSNAGNGLELQGPHSASSWHLSGAPWSSVTTGKQWFLYLEIKGAGSVLWGYEVLIPAKTKSYSL